METFLKGFVSTNFTKHTSVMMEKELNHDRREKRGRIDFIISSVL